MQYTHIQADLIGLIGFFYKPKSGLIKLIGFLKSLSLTHLLNEVGRAELLVDRAIGP